MPMARQDKTSTITIGGLEVQLTRKHVRNINLRVRRDGTICVSAPQRVPLATIEQFIESRSAWIRQAQARVVSQTAYTQATCVDGEAIMIWGEEVVCHVRLQPQGGRGPRVSIERHGEELIVGVRASGATGEEQDIAQRTKALDRWLREELSRRIDEVLPHCEQLVGKKASGIRLRTMTSRWGSCNVSSGFITINTQLVHFDPRCLEYVLIHELCHLYEPSHNARFHALMDNFCPDWRARRAMLGSRPDPSA